jgi:hypothetical protein
MAIFNPNQFPILVQNTFSHLCPYLLSLPYFSDRVKSRRQTQGGEEGKSALRTKVTW